MRKGRKIVVIGKQRRYDEEKWRQFITALAYALHEREAAAEKEAETPEDGKESAS